MAKDRIFQYINKMQTQIKSEFDLIKEKHDHSGIKGYKVECIIRDFLIKYLPPYNKIGHGEIIDTAGDISSQTDIIITNEYHPYTVDLNRPNLFFIEGVACIGEVKSTLTSDEFTKSLQNCFRFKNLKIKMSKGMQVYCNDSDIKRFIERRPYFLFAFDSQLAIDNIIEKVREFNNNNAKEIWQQIDAIFLLDRGSIINFGNGKGSYKYILNENHKSQPGYVIFRIENKPNMLFDFLAWISVVIQKYIIYENIITYYLINEE